MHNSHKSRTFSPSVGFRHCKLYKVFKHLYKTFFFINYQLKISFHRINGTHPCSLHLNEDGSLEGFFPECQLCAQLHTEAVALPVTHKHTKAEPLAVPQLTVLLQAHAQLWLNPAVLSYPQLCRETRPTCYILTWSFMVTLLLMNRTAISTRCCWHKILIINIELHLMNLKENLTEVKCCLGLSPFWCTSLGEKNTILHLVFLYNIHRIVEEDSALWCLAVLIILDYFWYSWNCRSANLQICLISFSTAHRTEQLAKFYSKCVPRAKLTQIY